MLNLSEKQRKVLIDKSKKFTILCGVTGSGKSYIANLKFYYELCKLSKNDTVLLTAATSQTLYKNVIKDLLSFDKNGFLEYTRSPHMLRTKSGVEVFCIGIGDEGAEKRLRGGNSAYWYADEVTTYPKTSFDMCLSRLRGVDANNNLEQKPCLFTLNPDSPVHYFKTNFIDNNKIDKNYYEFGFKDNPAISDDYVNSIKNLYTGVFYSRMIEGKWVGDADKLVVPEFINKENELVKEFDLPKHYEYYGALDPAVADNTAYVVGYYDFINARFIINNEFLLKKEATPAIAKKMLQVEKETYGDKKPYMRVSDTELQLILDLNRLHNVKVVATRKDNKEAQINYLRTLITQNKLFIHPRCENLIRQLKTATWNNNRTSYERNDVDAHFDLVDALLYLIRNINIHHNPYPQYEPEILNNPNIVLNNYKKHNNDLRQIMRGVV